MTKYIMSMTYWREIGIRTVFISIISLSGCGFPASPVPDIVDESLTEAYRRDVSTLASDAFMGRKPGTDGGQLTIDYLVNAFKEIGLEPGNGDSYLQQVELEETKSTIKGKITLASAGSTGELVQNQDIVARIIGNESQLILDDVELVFVGFGITAPEYDWDDYADVDVEGKVVVLLRNDPGSATGDSTLFAGATGTRYGYRNVKFQLARDHDAIGTLFIFDPAISAGTYTWKQLVGSFSRGRSDMASSTTDGHPDHMISYINVGAARRLFKLVGYDYDSLLVSASTPDHQSQILPLNVSGVVNTTRNRYRSSNVLGLLRGTERPDEVIIYTAHWDHVGMDTTLEGDQIFNGAMDNATGTAAILSLARAFKSMANPPKRSILFMAFTAEEMGLLGSKYYANHPVHPLNKTVGSINIDVLSHGGATNDIVVLGLGKSDLDKYVKRAAKKLGMYVQDDLWPEENYYFRSDHINLARVGVPALYMSPGVDDKQFGKDWGMQLMQDYTEQHYHQVSDEYTPVWNLDRIMDYLQISFDVGYTLANSSKFPNWKKNDDFRPVRDASMAESNDE